MSPWVRLSRVSLVLLLLACGDSAPRVEDDAGGLADAAIGSPDASDPGGLPGAEPDAGMAPDAGPPDLVALCGAIPESLDDWERCYLERLCACDAWQFTDAQECVQLFDAVSGGQLAYEARERRRAVEAGRAFLDEEAFAQCLVDLGTCFYIHFIPSCARRFVGAVADEGDCYNDIECESPGARCMAEECRDACCVGTCERLLREGEPCDDLYACEPGLVCSLSTWTCVIGDIGSSCQGHDCDPEAWCDKAAGICKPDLAEGDLCTSLLQCNGDGLGCVGLKRNFNNGEPGHCQRIAVEGDKCDWFCIGDLYCDFSMPDDGYGTCRSLPRLDEACGPLLPCLGRNNTCYEGRCAALPDVNEPCLDGLCRPGLRCTDLPGPRGSVCKDPLADGKGACSAPSDCESYICSGDESEPGECQRWTDTCP